MASLTEFTIRAATVADIPALQVLIEQSVRGLQRNDYSSAQIDASIGSAFGVDRQLLLDQTYFVAVPSADPRQLVACGGWSYRRTLYGSDRHVVRDSSLLVPATDFAKIRAIFVHPLWARRGLGTLMLTHCETAAVAAGFHCFEMGSTLTGVPLYTLKGYTERERISVALPGAESLEVVVMQKRL